MRRNKSSLSKGQTYQEIGEFWDAHDLTDFEQQTKPVECEVSLQSEETWFALESGLSTQVRKLAEQRGVSPETLLNLWVQEKLQDEAA